MYEAVVNMIADNEPYNDILNYVIEQINIMCSNAKPYTDFIITKAIGNHNNLNEEEFTNEKGIKKAKVGDYTVPLLSKNEEKRDNQLKKKKLIYKEFNNDILGKMRKQLINLKREENEMNTNKKIIDEVKQCDYYLTCLPAQVQLAERMRRRGKRVDPGSRLEFVVTDPENHTAKQSEKIESVEYFAKHKDVIKIDFMYYLKALVNPLDQVLNTALKNETNFKPGFTNRQYKFRWKIRSKLINEIKNLFKPILVFYD